MVNKTVFVDNKMLTGTICGKYKEDFPEIVWCDECETLLCHDCNKIHRRWSKFKSHNAVSIQVFIQLGSEMGSDVAKCYNHDRPLNHVCILYDYCKHYFVIAQGTSEMNEMRTSSLYAEVEPKGTEYTSKVKLQPTPLPDKLLSKMTCSS